MTYRLGQLAVAGCGLLALAACMQITITEHGQDDGQGGGETNGAPGTVCPTDAGGADASLPPGDDEPDVHVDVDGPPLDASADDVVDASCSGDDAAVDSGTDADDAAVDSGIDATMDSSSDASGESDAAQPDDGGFDASEGGPSDAGADPIPSSEVTCTFKRTHADLELCKSCVLPAETTITISHVPLWIEYGGGTIPGQGDLPPQPPPPKPVKRAIHVDAPTLFAQFWDYGNAFILSGAIGNESWVSATGLLVVLNGSLNGTITVGEGNATNVSLSGQRLPGTVLCSYVHGCTIEEITCTGTGVAENR